MKFTDHTISLDMHEASAQVALNVRQGDTKRRILAVLTEGKTAYIIGEGCTVKFFAQKPDGTVLVEDCMVVDTGDMIVYEFSEETAAVAGWMDCEFKLYSAQGKPALTTPRFQIYVVSAV